MMGKSSPALKRPQSNPMKWEDYRKNLAVKQTQEAVTSNTCQKEVLCHKEHVRVQKHVHVWKHHQQCRGLIKVLWRVLFHTFGNLQQLRKAPGNIQEGKTSSFLPISYSSISVQGPIIQTVTQRHLVLHDSSNIWQTLNNSGTTWE